MTRFTSNNVGFGCRVAAVLLHEGHILLQGEPEGSYWTLPGGGIELLEPAQDALRREMREELDIQVHIDRLLWFVEQFFEDDQHQAHHELALFFHVTLVDAPHLLDLQHTFCAKEGEKAILFRWFHLEELQDILLYPSFLPRGLLDLPKTPQLLTEQSIPLTRNPLIVDVRS